jgi:peptidoglycan-N-acetylglucosamine deacetylase
MIKELSAVAGVCAAWGGLCLGPQLFKAARIRSLRRVCQQTRTLVLTFDDGPSSDLTQRLLDLLAEFDARATFFLLGRQIPGREPILDRMTSAGHEIGSHTQHHLHAWKTLPWNSIADIRHGYAAVQRWAPPAAPFRPPYGKLTFHTWAVVRARKAPLAFWTLDSGDTYPRFPGPKEIAASLTRAGGGVVLLHDFDRPNYGGAHTAYVLQTTRLLLETAKTQSLNVSRFGDLLRQSALGATTPAAQFPLDQPTA